MSAKLVRQKAVADDKAPQDDGQPGDEQAPQPLSRSWSSVDAFIAECGPLAKELEANAQTKHDRQCELRRLAEHAAGELEEGTYKQNWEKPAVDEVVPSI